MSYYYYNNSTTALPTYMQTQQDMVDSGQYFYSGSSLHSAVGTCWCGIVHNVERQRLEQIRKKEELMNERDMRKTAYDAGYETGERWGNVFQLKPRVSKGDLNLFSIPLAKAAGYTDLESGATWCGGFADGVLATNEVAEPLFLEDKASSKK